jgi:hypothetical protein
MTKRMLAAVAAAMILSVIAAPVASAQPSSPGCSFLNIPVHDAHYFSSTPQPYDLVAGDRLTMAAGAPTSEGNPTTVTLFIDGVVVDTAAFPGVVEVEIEASGTYEIEWAIDAGNATWMVGCNAPDCSAVTVSPESLKSDSKLHEVTISGATVDDGDTISYAITAVTQDEPTSGGWRQDLKMPDANGIDAGAVSLRGERNPSLNGRVYRVSYTVTSGRGGDCSGIETVGVSVHKGAAVDDGDRASWNSFTGQLIPG